MNDYKHYHKYQEDEPVGNVLASVVLIGFGFIAGMTCVYGGYKLTQPKKADGIDCRTCHGKIAAYTDYFRKAGSKQPQKMAEAVLSTRNPRLMAAVAKIETHGNPDAIIIGSSAETTRCLIRVSYHSRDL